VSIGVGGIWKVADSDISEPKDVPVARQMPVKDHKTQKKER
jgi:hypothetical protein